MLWAARGVKQLVEVMADVTFCRVLEQQALGFNRACRFPSYTRTAVLTTTAR
jgi:hypothetical protein